jgi:hypothetical protein
LGSEWIVDGSAEYSGVDRSQCRDEFPSGPGSKVVQSDLEQSADVPGGNVGVPVVPFHGVAGSTCSAFPAKERVGRIPLVEVSPAFELGDLSVGGGGQAPDDNPPLVPRAPTRQLSSDLARCSARHMDFLR